uniref:Uncharacterized protein n=1 Tax=Oryza brachyantha TaxID=4533 RepID=J3LXG0_ORYBR
PRRRTRRRPWRTRPCCSATRARSTAPAPSCSSPCTRPRDRVIDRSSSPLIPP